MPSLIVSSRFTTDSQVLRQTAQQLGWETLRLDGTQVPEWSEPGDGQIAIFHTAPVAFEIAAQLSRTLVGCNPDWVVGLPREGVSREIRQITLRQALEMPGASFVKHAISKAFPAAVYDARSLAEATGSIPPEALVHVCEPVAWSVEYRCFITERDITTLSPYRRQGQIIEDHTSLLGAPLDEIEAAREFCRSVVQSPHVECPPAIVLDLGMIENRGWAVVEFNECWASGIYACDPTAVLETLLAACVPTESLTADLRRWDFRPHYVRGCGSIISE